MSTFSAVVNGQLVPVAPANAIVAPPAGQPVISAGAYANNLPGFSLMGGATNVPMPQAKAATSNANSNTAATVGSTSTNGGNGLSSISGLTGNVWALPFWENPLALTLLFLVFAYFVLRWVHWGPRG